MFKKITITQIASMLRICLLLLLFISASSGAVYAQIQGEMDNAADTLMTILTGSVSMILGGFLVLAGVFQLTQKNWSGAACLLIAAIFLLKLKTLMMLFGGH